VAASAVHERAPAVRAGGRDREALLFVSRALCGDLAAELGLRGAGAKRCEASRLRTHEADERESIRPPPAVQRCGLFGLIVNVKEWQPRAPTRSCWIELPVLEAAAGAAAAVGGRRWNGEEVVAAFERCRNVMARTWSASRGRRSSPPHSPRSASRDPLLSSPPWSSSRWPLTARSASYQAR